MADHVFLNARIADAGVNGWNRSWNIGAEAPFRHG
jgi:hypothetical protein